MLHTREVAAHQPAGTSTLRGDAAAHFLDGGPNDDLLIANLDNEGEFVTGGTGTDRAIVEPGLDLLAGVETVQA